MLKRPVRSIELQQQQVQRLNQQQLQGLSILQMNSAELETYLQELSQENPLIELNECREAAPAGERSSLLDRLQWLEHNDLQNRYYTRTDADDPLARISGPSGLDETLTGFVLRQLEPMGLDRRSLCLVEFLADCLDKDGYFRHEVEEFARDTTLAPAQIQWGLSLLRTLEPAGIGAADLSQCLCLQLGRIGETGPALEIARDHLEELARGHYHSIAAKLGISTDAVLQAQKLIQELEPRPGAIFHHSDQIPYITPDVFVDEVQGDLVLRLGTGDQPPFLLDRYYQDLLETSPDPEVHTYLLEKLRHAQGVLQALQQRESTLRRCAQLILTRQSEFFRWGPSALRPLTMAETAQALELHESTVSRAVRGKYLQCRWGVFPLSHFFSRGLSHRNGEKQAVGADAARTLLRQFIDGEDRHAPLSDQRLCQLLEQSGCTISRRTVAKYREEMGIPSTTRRRER